MEELKKIEAHVRGNVQGVFFRDFVKKNALALSLTGYVENVSDGCVHVVAQGMEGGLLKLIEYLHEGPSGTNVSRVDVTWYEPSEEFLEFSITY